MSEASKEPSKEQLLEYVKKAKSRIKKLESDLINMKELEKLPNELSSLQQVLEEKESENEKLRTELSQKLETIIPVSNSDAALERELDTTKQKLAKYNALIKAKVKELDVKDKEIEELQREVQKYREVEGSGSKDDSGDLERTRTLVKEYEEKITKLQNSLNESTIRIEAFEAERSSSATEISKLLRQLESATTKEATLQMENQSKIDLEESVKQWRDTVQRLETQIEETQATAEAKYAELEQKLVLSQEALSSERAHASKVGPLEDEIVQLNQKLLAASAQSTLEESKSCSLLSRVAELEAALETESQALKREIENHEIALRVKEGEIEALVQARRELESRNDALEKQNTISRIAIRDLKAAVVRLQQESAKVPKVSTAPSPAPAPTVVPSPSQSPAPAPAPAGGGKNKKKNKKGKGAQTDTASPPPSTVPTSEAAAITADEETSQSPTGGDSPETAAPTGTGAGAPAAAGEAEGSSDAFIASDAELESYREQLVTSMSLQREQAAELDAFKMRFAELEQDVASNAALAQALAAKDALEASLSTLQSEHTSSLARLETLSQELLQSASALQALAEEKSRLESDTQAGAADLVELSALLSKAQEQLTAKESELSELGVKLAALVDAQATSANSSSAILQQHEALVAQLRRDLEIAQGDKASQEAHLVEAVGTIASLQDQLATLQRSAASTSTSAGEHASQLSEALAQEQSRHAQTRDILQALKREVERESEALDETKKGHESAISACETLKEQLAQEKQQCGELEAACETLRQQVTQLRAQVADLENAVATLKQGSSQELVVLHDQFKAAESKLEQSNQELTTEQARNADLQSRVDELAAKILQSQAEGTANVPHEAPATAPVVDADAEAGGATAEAEAGGPSQLKGLEATNKKLMARLKVALKEIAELKSKAIADSADPSGHDSDSHLLQLNSQLDAHKSRIAELEDSLAVAQSQIASVASAVAPAAGATAATSSAEGAESADGATGGDDTPTAAEEGSSRIKSLEAKNKTLATRLKTLMKEHNELKTSLKVSKKLSADDEAQSSPLSPAPAVDDERIVELSAQLESYQSRVAELEGNLAAAQSQLSSANAENAEIREQLAVKASLSPEQSTSAATTDNPVPLPTAADAATSSAEGAESADGATGGDDTPTAAEEGSSRIKSLEAKNKTLATRLKTLMKEHNELKTSLKVSKKLSADDEAQSSPLSPAPAVDDERIVELSAQLESYQSRVAELEGNLAAVQSRLSSKNAEDQAVTLVVPSAEEVATLQSELAAASDKISILSTEVADHVCSIEELQKLLSVAESTKKQFHERENELESRIEELQQQLEYAADQLRRARSEARDREEERAAAREATRTRAGDGDADAPSSPSGDRFSSSMPTTPAALTMSFFEVETPPAPSSLLDPALPPSPSGVSKILEFANSSDAEENASPHEVIATKRTKEPADEEDAETAAITASHTAPADKGPDSNASLSTEELYQRLALAEEDAAQAREERERQRQRVLDLEGELEANHQQMHILRASVSDTDTATSETLQGLEARVDELRRLLASAVDEKVALSAALDESGAEATSLRAELATAKAAAATSLESLSGARERIEYVEDALQQTERALQQAEQAHKAEAAQMAGEIASLKDEIVALTEGAAVSRQIASRLQGRIDEIEAERDRTTSRLQGRIEELETERDHISRQKQMAEDEHSLQKKETELTNKKLMAKLKLTMKELNELKAAHQAQTEVLEATKASLAAAEAARDAANARIAELNDIVEQKETQEKVARAGFESKVAAYKKKLERIQGDVTRLTAEKAEVEQMLQSTKASLENAMIALDLQRGSVEAEEQAAATAKALSIATEKVKDLTSQVEALLKDKDENQAKMDVLTDKIKRMRTLLAKTKNIAQEREAEVAKYTQSGISAPRFAVVARLALATATFNEAFEESKTARQKDDESSGSRTWCLISEPLSSSEESSGLTFSTRWIEENLVQEWLDSGSDLVGEWPATLEDVWAGNLAAQAAKYEEEKSALRGEVEEVTNAFNAYKTRAQIALKRVGVEDRTERHRALQSENERIAELNGAVADLEVQLRAARGALQEQSGSSDHLREHIDSLTAALDATQQQLDAEKALVATQQQTIAELQEVLATASAAAAAAAGAGAGASSESVAPLGAAFTPGPRSARQSTAGMPFETPNERLNELAEILASPRLHSLSKGPKPSPSPSALARSDEGKNEDDWKFHSVDLSEAELQIPREGDEGEGEGESSSSDAVSPTFSKPSGQALVMQQFDHELRDVVELLRKDNSLLLAEVNDLKRTIALNDEQMVALKDTVIELQAALTREKEFNAAGQGLNTEYLVNVLRKFLLSEHRSERARLVVAITQLLHLRPDESKVIAEKWAVKASGGGGLVGWMLSGGGGGTASAQDVSKGGENASYDAFSDQGLNIYA